MIEGSLVNKSMNMNEAAGMAVVTPEENQKAKSRPNAHNMMESQTMSPPPTTTTTTTSRWQSNEWSYAAEGGKHALFRYAGTDLDFFGHLLRVAKIDLANASSSYHAKHDNIDRGISGSSGGVPTSSSASDVRTCRIIEFLNESPCRSFQRTVVQPLLGHCYLDLARLVRLPASCCTQLYDRTVASGSIPPSRLPTWMADNEATKISGSYYLDKPISLPESVKATLLRDHTFLSPHPRFSTSPTSVMKRKGIDSIENIESTGKQPKSNTILSVEIKPKAGYITTSPLVLPDHRCKYYRTRYSIQQELMQMGHVRKGWLRTNTTNTTSGRDSDESTTMQNDTTFTPSNYSPLDLFSGNNARIQKALYDLSQNMQNNFRVWCNGQQIFGEYETTSDINCQEILNDIFLVKTDNDYNAKDPEWSHPKSTLLEVITKTVSTVLSRESLLSNMLSMQELDVIDGDGAIFVYQRLVGLCGGSQEEAEKALDDASLITRDGVLLGQSDPTPTGRASDYLFASSPYEVPKCDALDKLLDEIVQFQIYLHSRVKDGSSGPDEAVMNASHAKCVLYVSQLSKEACIYLLQNWLLSLALCDVSFFVTFRFLSDDELATVAAESVEECQSCHHGGIALCSMQDSTEHDSQQQPTTLAVHYEVKIVDCDPKPAKKIRNRGESESKFKLIHN